MNNSEVYRYPKYCAIGYRWNTQEECYFIEECLKTLGPAGTKRVLDRRQIFVAVMHQLFVGLLWSQIGFQHRTPIEFGGFLLHAGIDSQCHGALCREERGCLRARELEL